MKQFVVFELAQQKYAFDISYVNEITNFADVTPIPQSHPLLEGVVNLRGKIVPLVSLIRVFGKTDGGQPGQQIIIVNAAEEQVGFIIDHARDVKSFDEADILPMSGVIAAADSFVTGTINLSGEIIQMICVERILEPFKLKN